MAALVPYSVVALLASALAIDKGLVDGTDRKAALLLSIEVSSIGTQHTGLIVCADSALSADTGAISILFVLSAFAKARLQTGHIVLRLEALVANLPNSIPPLLAFALSEGRGVVLSL